MKRALLFIVPALLLFQGCRTTYPITDGFHHALPDSNQRIVVWGNTTAVTGTTTTWLQKRGVKIVERARLLQLFDEQRIRLTHTSDDEGPILRIGKLLGAGMVVFADGSASEGLASTYTMGPYGGTGGSHSVYGVAVTIRGVDVESSEILWSATARYPRQVGGSPEDGLMKLTCQALATAWGFRPPGHLNISSEATCAATKPIPLATSNDGS
jgi:hypothetical protein